MTKRCSVINIYITIALQIPIGTVEMMYTLFGLFDLARSEKLFSLSFKTRAHKKTWKEGPL